MSLLAWLSQVFAVDLEKLLAGELDPNSQAAGNLKNLHFYVCPTCGSITLCTGSAAVSCCGRPLEALTARKAEENEKLHTEVVEDEWFITSDHPMAKDCYISFLAFATGEKIELVKAYPEWDLHVRIPKRGHGMLLWYSTRDRLLYQLL